MPRIQAESVAEHVANQEQLVFSTAIRLFSEHGYAHVSFGDIANEVGLARNSLYRYFPGKDAILIRWFQTELAGRLARSRELLEADGEPIDLTLDWADDQLDYASQPGHRLMAAIEQIEPELAPEFRTQLSASHDALMAPLRHLLTRAGVADVAEQDVICDLISGLILAAARYENRGGSNAVLRGHLHDAIRSLIH